MEYLPTLLPYLWRNKSANMSCNTMRANYSITNLPKPNEEL